MKPHIMRLLVVLALLLILLPGLAHASNPNGVSSQDLYLDTTGSGPNCKVTCHEIQEAGASVSITFVPDCTVTDNCFTDTTDIQITVTTSSIPGDENFMGIALYNTAGSFGGLNIKDDGWGITADPEGNSPTPFNYNLFTDGRDRAETWTVDAPGTATTYSMWTQARHGMSSGGGDRKVDSGVVTLYIGASLPEFPIGAVLLVPTLGLVYLIMKKREEAAYFKRAG